MYRVGLGAGVLSTGADAEVDAAVAPVSSAAGGACVITTSMSG